MSKEIAGVIGIGGDTFSGVCARTLCWLQKNSKSIFICKNNIADKKGVKMDTITTMNLAFCIIIACLGYWGYLQSRKISKVLHVLPMYVGIAFALFGVSHFVNLVGLGGTLANALIVVRSLAYIIVIVSMAWVVRASVKLHKQSLEQKTPTT